LVDIIDAKKAKADICSGIFSIPHCLTKCLILLFKKNLGQLTPVQLGGGVVCKLTVNASKREDVPSVRDKASSLGSRKTPLTGDRLVSRWKILLCNCCVLLGIE
jgi:hypothetical protein